MPNRASSVNQVSPELVDERCLFLAETVRETLGPRGAPDEVIDFRPDDDGGYITGWLAPLEESRAGHSRDEFATSQARLEIEAGVAEPDAATPIFSLDQSTDVADAAWAPDQEDQDAGPEVSGSLSSSIPYLEPGHMPSAMGITFLATGNPICLSIAVTWARYSPHYLDDDKNCNRSHWKRVPHGQVFNDLRLVPGNSSTCEPIALGAKSDCFSLEFKVGRRRPENGSHPVSVFLVNRCKGGDRTSLSVFQPQLRIILGEGSNVVSLPDLTSPKDQDANKLKLLYLDRPVLAKGHLCGALWKAIDPERSSDDLRKLRIPNTYPFVWEDGRALAGDAFSRFTRPDLRTDYVPVSSVASPLADWQEEKYGPGPELSPEVLAEIYDVGALASALRPLPNAYERWLSDQLKEVARLPAEHTIPANENLERCKEILDRIREGIRLLCLPDNSLVRLAFCFANKAMALQSSWSNQQLSRGIRAHPWRPFQLAFLLAEIPSIVDRSGTRRETCDLLWFPTGGGKTEGYLAVAPLPSDGAGWKVGRETARKATAFPFSLATPSAYLQSSSTDVLSQ